MDPIKKTDPAWLTAFCVAFFYVALVAIFAFTGFAVWGPWQASGWWMLSAMVFIRVTFGICR